METRDLGALLLLGALWGASYMFIRVAVPALGPFALMGLRVALAASVLALYAAFLVRDLPKFRSRWREFLIVGATNSAVPFTLIAAAEIELTASLAAILNSTTALFAAAVAAVWIGEALTMKKVFGLVMGLVGVAVLVGWDPIPLNSIVLLSVGAMLAASLSYAIGGVYVKRTFAGVPPLAMAIGQQAGAAVLLLPLAAVSLPEEAPPLPAALSALALTLLSTAVAYLLYFRLIENVGPTKTLTVTFLIPIFGLLFGVVLLGEPVGVGTLVGFGIILYSVALVTEVRLGGAKERDYPPSRG
ncbi:MAG TPA: DMT family transporter [Rubrobacteraceae bacterium]|nr:DMT family transporter [Rubrobacteraceae bacterium]